MARIKLILTDLALELDVKQDRNFPLALNYTAGSLKTINSRATDFSLEFRLPSTKNNRTALDNMSSTNTLDGNNILSKNACSVTLDAMPIFSGDFKLLGVVNDRGFEEFNCIILGSGMKWAESMKKKTLSDYDWGVPFTYDSADIISSWSNTFADDYVFPLINYGAWKAVGNVKVEDLRPAIFMRAMFKKLFEAEGFTVQMDTDTTDFFNTANNVIGDQVVIPFTGTRWIDSATLVNDNTFVGEAAGAANRSTHAAITKVVSIVKCYPQTYQGVSSVDTGLLYAGENVAESRSMRVFLRPSYSIPTITDNTYVVIPRASNASIRTPEGKVYKILKYGTMEHPSSSITGNTPYIDLLAQEGSPNQRNLRTLQDGDDVAVQFDLVFGTITAGQEDPSIIPLVTKSGDGVATFSTSTNKYTAPSPLASRFRFSSKIWSYNENTTNRGTFTFRIVHQVSGGDKFVVQEEKYEPTETSPINEYADVLYSGLPFFSYNGVKKASVVNVAFESGVVNLGTGDTVYVEVVSDHAQVSSASNILHSFVNFSAGGGDQETRTEVVVSDASFSSIPQADLVRGTTGVELKNHVDDRYNSLEYIKGCIHAFNLMIKTDPLSKTVIIKTRDDFYDTNLNANNWTEKLDIKKQYAIDYLDFYKRDLNFRFKKDGADKYVSELNRISDFEYGGQKTSLSERFDEGEQVMLNPLFAYTHHMIDTTIVDSTSTAIGGVFLARIWNDYSPTSIPPNKYYNFKPRLLLYDYSEQKTGLKWTFEKIPYSNVPAALPEDFGSFAPLVNFDAHLGYNDSASSETGLLSKYYGSTINTIEKGTRLTAPFKLTFKDIHNFDITKPIYLEYPAELKGYWLVEKIENYLPSANVSTTVELVKREDFGTRSLSHSSDAVIIEDDKEWVSEDQEFVDIGKFGGGDSKADAIDQANLADDSVKADAANKGKGGGLQQASSSSLSAAAALGKGRGAGSASRFDAPASSDEEAMDAAQEEEQKTGWFNSKGVLGAERVDAMSKNSTKNTYTRNNRDASMVQSSKGNKSTKGTGNFVSGVNNIASGKSQMVIGQNNKPNSSSVFSVGSGTDPDNRYNALDVGKDGIVREGGGTIFEEVGDNLSPIYEEVNGEMVKITI